MGRPGVVRFGLSESAGAAHCLGARGALVEQDTKSLEFNILTRENARAFACLAIGSGLALAPGDAPTSAPAAPHPRPSPVIRAAVLAPAQALRPPEDLNCLTQAVYYEARGESERGQAAVAQVVLNRVGNPIFPKTVCAVVFQGASRAQCQFSFACDGALRQPREDLAWDRARRIAERALKGSVMPEIGAATNFRAAGIDHRWGRGFIRVTQVGQHVFYRLGRPHEARAYPAAARTAPVQRETIASLTPPPPKPVEAAGPSA